MSYCNSIILKRYYCHYYCYCYCYCWLLLFLCFFCGGCCFSKSSQRFIFVVVDAASFQITVNNNHNHNHNKNVVVAWNHHHHHHHHSEKQNHPWRRTSTTSITTTSTFAKITTTTTTTLTNNNNNNKKKKGCWIRSQNTNLVVLAATAAGGSTANNNDNNNGSNNNKEEEILLISSLPVEMTKQQQQQQQQKKQKSSNDNNNEKKKKITNTKQISTKQEQSNKSTKQKATTTTTTTTTTTKETLSIPKTTTTTATTTTTTTTRRKRTSWEENFQRLQEYKQEYGDCLVPQTYSHEENNNNNNSDNNNNNNSDIHKTTKLGLWVHNQRKLKKMKTLKPEREDRLNEIGFSWEAYPDHWENMFQELIEFHDEYGHVNVENVQQNNSKYKKSQKKLADWVKNQRKSGALLTHEQRSKLDHLGFVWNNVKKIRVDQQWEERFQLLKEYKRIHGNTLVPKSWSSSSSSTKNNNTNGIIKLGVWVSTQRRFYRQKLLPNDRISKLNKIGFVWKVRRKQNNHHYHDNNSTDWELWLDEIWMEHFQTLQEFQRIHNHTNVPSRYDENPELGRWVQKQRENYRLGLLKKHRQELLENGLGFEWKYQEKMFENQWMEHYQNLVAFQTEYGRHVKVPFRKKKGHQDLYQWLKWQRMLFANDKLESDRKELLETIGIHLNVGPGSLGYVEEEDEEEEEEE